MTTRSELSQEWAARHGTPLAADELAHRLGEIIGQVTRHDFSDAEAEKLLRHLNGWLFELDAGTIAALGAGVGLWDEMELFIAARQLEEFRAAIPAKDAVLPSP